MLGEYFTSGDVGEVARQLQEAGQPQFGWALVKKAITLAMDRHDKEREMASVLLSALYGEVRTFQPLSLWPSRPQCRCHTRRMLEIGANPAHHLQKSRRLELRCASIAAILLNQTMCDIRLVKGLHLLVVFCVRFRAPHT